MSERFVLLIIKRNLQTIRTDGAKQTISCKLLSYLDRTLINVSGFVNRFGVLIHQTRIHEFNAYKINHLYYYIIMLLYDLYYTHVQLIILHPYATFAFV